MTEKLDVKQGTLALMILRTLDVLGPLHGYGIARRIEGLGGAFFASGVIRGLLFGVPPRDPVTLIGVAALMAAIGLGACWIPALRAARIDPAIAMRSQ
jgi:ABC-type lipoprotein release transport system permease subunit